MDKHLKAVELALNWMPSHAYEATFGLSAKSVDQKRAPNGSMRWNLQDFQTIGKTLGLHWHAIQVILDPDWMPKNVTTGRAGKYNEWETLRNSDPKWYRYFLEKQDEN